MEAGNNLRHTLTCIGLAMLCMAVHPAAGMVVAKPVEYSLTHAHVIVAGKVVEVTPDKKVTRKAGSRSYTDYYRLGYVKVDEALKNDLARFAVGRGDKIEIRLGPTARRMRALARERHIVSEEGPYRATEKGDGGIWLLYLLSPEQLPTFTLSCLLKAEMLSTVKDKLVRLDREYQDALRNEIPRYAEERRKFLSTPALTQAMADAAMGKAIAPEVDLADVYAVNYGNMQALFVANDGQIVGGVPYFASALVFREGYLPVATALDHVYSRYNCVDRNGKLLCSRFYSYAEPFSEGRALICDNNRFAGYIDVTGKEIIPCRYKFAEPFSQGTARVSNDGREFVLINTMGATVGKDTGERSRPGELVKISVRDEEQKVRLWGFADKQGNTVIPQKFLHVMDFSGGMAAIEKTVWAERSGFYGDPTIELSEKAHRHLLVARWGFINETGEIAIDPLFDGSPGPFQNGLANVRIYLRSKVPGQNSVFEGLIDKTGKLVLVKSNPSL